MKQRTALTLAITLSTMFAWPLAPSAHSQHSDTSPEPTLDSLTAHYIRAEQELRAADVSLLSVSQRHNRSLALDWLHEYRVNADFGVNTLQPGARTLYFIDEGDRRCAVAWLLDESGETDLVKEVAATNNHAYVAELAGNPMLQAWLNEYGLSVEEAARIQGPGLGGAVPDSASSSAPGSSAPPAPGPASGGGAPSTPSPSGPSGPSGPGAGPVTPGPGGPQAPGTATGLAGQPGFTVGPGVWMTWWELHKMDYLRPNLLKNWHGTVTGWENDSSNPLDAVRAGLLPDLLKALNAGNAQLRGSAAIAIGRMGGEGAIEPLLVKLGDRSLEVRERAILALGATGSMRAAETLLEIARTGGTDKVRRVSSEARSLAILALAIGRRNGMNGYVDHAVLALLQNAKGASRFSVQSSGLLYQTMNPSAALGDWSLALANDKSTPLGVRCRAVETLRTRDDEESLKVLLHHLSGRSLELRRSAALTLGEFNHDLALQPLMTAAEIENEPLTRAFLLISIGRQGGETARKFLQHYQENGSKASRSWSALALGILARESDSEEARAALRKGLKREKNREYRGAYYLAMGIAQDVQARDVLIEALENGSSYEIRSGAAMGLGMLRDPKGIEALRRQILVDKCEYTRAAIAEAIGFLGNYNDCDLLASQLNDMNVSVNQSTTALALGLHGERRSVEELVRILKDEQEPDLKRAAAIDSLQIVLGREPSLAVSELLRQSNFLIFPSSLVKIRRVHL